MNYWHLWSCSELQTPLYNLLLTRFLWIARERPCQDQTHSLLPYRGLFPGCTVLVTYILVFAAEQAGYPRTPLKAPPYEACGLYHQILLICLHTALPNLAAPSLPLSCVQPPVAASHRSSMATSQHGCLTACLRARRPSSSLLPPVGRVIFKTEILTLPAPS